MRKTLAEYKTDFGYEDEKCAYYEDAFGLLQCGILGFCGCGAGEENLLYVLRGLELIDEKGPASHEEWRIWWDGHNARVKEHFKTSEAQYFFFYWCDKEDFTEHGGSVPGWLTDKGHNVLAMLREWREYAEEA
jgi:hypothetical protein